MLDEDPPDPGTPEFEDWKRRHSRAEAELSRWRAHQAAARYRREDFRAIGGGLADGDGGLTCPGDER